GYISCKIPMKRELSIHGNTSLCPTNIRELNPAFDSCEIGCQYCLVGHGAHEKKVSVYMNYPEYIAKKLKENEGKKIIYYLSPKTEIFQKPLLETRVAHKILKAFRNHYTQFPKSTARLFIVTKGGIDQANIKVDGETILDHLTALGKHLRLCGSVGIMSLGIRKTLEPNAPSVEKRMKFLNELHKRGVSAPGILMQPLLEPFVTEKSVREQFKMFSDGGIKHIKAEFLTLTPENMVGLFQLIGHFDKKAEKELWERRLGSSAELKETKKGRIPPANMDYLKKEYLLIKEIAEKEFNITVSLCAWVRMITRMLKFNEKGEQKGYGCMGQWEV
ncbi:MAG: hypothetical protein KAU95_04640, partial [Candidatus Aenigmarchaeota archaeon]|nr:hypothetical protein [Candidatus Aenigmarchaeota archaeon]